MPKFPEITVEKRTLIGRKVKQLRQQGLIPANVFGRKITSIAVQLPATTFTKVFDQVGETGIISLTIGDKKFPCLIKGMANHPVTGQILHVDFHNVSLTEKVTAAIPVESIGESPAIKEFGAIINQNIHEIEVEALPTELPESIEIDLSTLAAIGDTITFKDIKLPEGVVAQLDPDTIIVAADEPAPEEVVEETPAEAEVGAEDAKADSEAEGDAKPAAEESPAKE
jgi:large subunit ribosomal protein L25